MQHAAESDFTTSFLHSTTSGQNTFNSLFVIAPYQYSDLTPLIIAVLTVLTPAIFRDSAYWVTPPMKSVTQSDI